MERQEMIEAIYLKLANETLSFGCKVKKLDDLNNPFTDRIISLNMHGECITEFNGLGLVNEFRIIGHPVMIGDVLDYMEKKKHIMTVTGDFEGVKGNEKCIKEEYNILFEFKKIIFLWQEKRKPIDEQNDECIEYAYNLIK